MKALLIWPKFSSFSFWNFEEVCRLAGTRYMTPPLGLLTVGALLPQDWDIRLVDENVRMIQEEDLLWADLVLVGSKIVHRPRALELIRWAKKVGKPVVSGGPDPTLSPEIFQEAGADFLCLDEGERTIPMLVADLERGVTGAVYRQDRLPEIDRETPVPRFDLIDFKNYLYVGIQYSRGCPYHCEFCNVIDLFANRYRTKSTEQVIAELQRLYDLGYRGQVDFFDDNLVGNVPKAKELLAAIAGWLKEHKYPFIHSTSVTLNIARDDELLELLRAARFKYLLVGIETPDENALRVAAKPHNTGFSITEAVHRIYDVAGATVHSGFLLGLDGEPADIGDRVVRCVEDTSIPWVMAGVVYPLPGTKLARRLDAEGRLFPKARKFDDEKVRDQISAGLQFKAERPSADVVRDLIKVLEHAYDPKRYFERCAKVAIRLNTDPVLVPGWRVFFRNLRTFGRLCWRATWSSSMRGPFWRAFWKVLFKNRRGIEALVTLAVLYVHFQGMLPYCFEQLEGQVAAIEKDGEEAWLAENLREVEPAARGRAAEPEAGASPGGDASAAGGAKLVATAAPLRGPAR